MTGAGCEHRARGGKGEQEPGCPFHEGPILRHRGAIRTEGSELHHGVEIRAAHRAGAVRGTFRITASCRSPGLGGFLRS